VRVQADRIFQIIDIDNSGDVTFDEFARVFLISIYKLKHIYVYIYVCIYICAHVHMHLYIH